jgi:hypothetical protein
MLTLKTCDADHKTKTNPIEDKQKKTRSKILNKKILRNEIEKKNNKKGFKTKQNK